MRYRRPDEPQPVTAEGFFRENCTNDVLRDLLRVCCPSLKVTRKDDMIAALVALQQEDKLPFALEQLSPIQRSAAAETAWSDDGEYDARRFEAKHGQSPWPAPSEEDKRFSWRQPKPVWLNLLIVDGVMPRDVQRRLRGLLPKPAASKVETVANPPASIEQTVHVWRETEKRYEDEAVAVPVQEHCMEPAALHDLRAVLRLVDAGQVAVSEKIHWPTPASMKHIVTVLDGGDFYLQPGEEMPASSDELSDRFKPGPIRAFAWPLILQAGGLAEPGAKQKLVLTKAGRQALLAAPHEVLRSLWQAWLSNDQIDELRRISQIRGQTGNGGRHLTKPAWRRKSIGRALGNCPPGQWISIDAFSRFVRGSEDAFEVTDDLWSLYFFEQQYGALAYDGFDAWAILQLRYMLVLLMEYAATMGLIDVACIPPVGARSDFYGPWGTDDMACLSRYDGLLCFRLTAVGAYCLGITEAFFPTPRARQPLLEVMPSLTIRTPGGFPPADRLLLDAFAQNITEGEWRLDRGKTLEAIAAGRATDEMVQLLEAGSDQPLPDRVLGFFAEANAHANAFSDLGGARLFRCNDLDRLAVLLSHAPIRKLCTRLDQDILVVTEKNETAFRKAMSALGFALPRV